MKDGLTKKTKVGKDWSTMFCEGTVFKNVCAFLLKIVLTDTDLDQEINQDKLNMDGKQIFQFAAQNVINKKIACHLSISKMTQNASFMMIKQ